MTPTTPRAGERWRFTVEGVVSAASTLAVALDTTHDGDGDGDWYMPVRYGTWERLPDPEPDWQPGDLVLDANDDIYRRRNTEITGTRYPWSPVGQDRACIEEALRRPLRRLVVAE